MEPINDLDALLKIASEKDKNAVSSSEVDYMINGRLELANKKFNNDILNEIVVLVVCLAFFAATWLYSFPKMHGEAVVFFKKIYIIAGVYLIISKLLFIRLIKAARLPRENAVLTYLNSLKYDTSLTLNIYIWLTNITAGTIVFFALQFYKLPTFKLIAGAVAMMCLAHCLNKMYVNSRFGKRVQELDILRKELL